MKQILVNKVTTRNILQQILNLYSCETSDFFTFSKFLFCGHLLKVVFQIFLASITEQLKKETDIVNQDCNRTVFYGVICIIPVTFCLFISGSRSYFPATIHSVYPVSKVVQTLSIEF